MPPMPSLDSGLRRNDECEGIPSDAGMTRPTVVTETIHPGSESGTCFRTNRPCRLVPAHQGMKMRPWSLDVFGCGWCHPSPLDSRFRENDEFGGRG